MNIGFDNLNISEFSAIEDMCLNHPGWKALEKWMADACIDVAKIPMMHPPEDIRKYDQASGSAQAFHMMAHEFAGDLEKEADSRRAEAVEKSKK